MGQNKNDKNGAPVSGTTLVVVSAAQTSWRAQGRFAGDTDLPLNEQGHRQAVADAHALAELEPVLVYAAPEQATRQTADIVAHELNIKVKALNELREMDLGLWEGLTTDDFRDRFAKVYRQWRHEPMSIEPPEGEAVAHVAVRLCKGLAKIVKRAQGQTVVLALGQFAYAIVRCRLSDRCYERFWEYVDGEGGWSTIKVNSLAEVEATASQAASEGAEGAETL